MKQERFNLDLSIIIVNWNSKEYLRKCIASVLSNTFGIEFEIIVIDSASYDGSKEMLQRNFPHVRFIQSHRNLGFAKSNNAAYHESRGRFILFLNPDTELITPAINVMFDFLQRKPKAGIIGCKLLNADKTIQTSCVQTFPTIINQTMNSEFLRELWPKSQLWGMAPLYDNKNEAVEVEMLSGACIMIQREIFKKVKLFSSDYFMYGEDIDLCYKVIKAGYKNYYMPCATVIHYGGGSTQNTQSDFSVVMMRQSIWQFLRKTRGDFYSLGYRFAMLISAIGRISLLLTLLPKYVRKGKRDRWKASFRKWRAIFIWSLNIKFV